MAVILVVVIPHLPPGICFGDSGELQLAAITLGITHAPGYPILASLGYLFTLIPGMNDAYAVSLACLGAGAIVLWLCYLLQLRLGVRAGIAGALTLAMAAHSRTWVNLIAPEAYAPTLAMQAGAVYLLIRHARTGETRDLYVAALLLGAAVANRPPVVFMIPFVLAAWWMTRRQRGETSRRSSARSLGWCVLFAALPGVYALGYLYARDATSTAYNYIELHDREFNMVPDLADGFPAKMERVMWHASAQEFDYAMGNDFKGIWNKLRWLRGEFFLYQPGAFVLSLGLMLAGGRQLLRCSVPGSLLLGGMMFGNLVFLCVYRMWGQAADYLPLLWSAVVLMGMSTTIVSGAKWDRWFQHGGLITWAVLGVLTVTGTFRGPRAALAGDAVPFVQRMDLSTLPENAVICVAWPETPAVFYARYVDAARTDVEVLGAATGNWERLLESYKSRPIFGASYNPELTRFNAIPFRNIWRLEPRHASSMEREIPDRPSVRSDVGASKRFVPCAGSAWVVGSG